MNKNIFGEKLITCSNNPMTGFFRNGCCDTDDSDLGMHTVCVILNNEFLLFSKSRGNDLSTSVPEFGFKGLKAGDKWCLCALRWKEALIHNMAPKVILEATNEKTLDVIKIQDLLNHSHKKNESSEK
tara:strand:+ start:149 stop:529 length:381 start_codon:yes stop_codon:yes gene_type:complete